MLDVAVHANPLLLTLEDEAAESASNLVVGLPRAFFALVSVSQSFGAELEAAVAAVAHRHVVRTVRFR